MVRHATMVVYWFKCSVCRSACHELSCACVLMGEYSWLTSKSVCGYAISLSQIPGGAPNRREDKVLPLTKNMVSSVFFFTQNPTFYRPALYTDWSIQGHLTLVTSYPLTSLDVHNLIKYLFHNNFISKLMRMTPCSSCTRTPVYSYLILTY